MITTIITDFSRVLLFPKDKTYTGSLNDLHRKLLQEKGENYDFFHHFVFNEELFREYKNLNGQYALYIFTTDTIQERREVREMLDEVVSDIFVANHHDFKKNDIAAYTFIANKLQKMPQTFVYIDDTEENIEAATKAGMNGVHYKDNTQLLQDLKLLNIK